MRDISNYAINRLAAKSYNLTVFWKGKTEKGDKRFIRIDLGKRFEVVVGTMKVMEIILDEIGDYDILDGLKEDVKKVDGWGAE